MNRRSFISTVGGSFAAAAGCVPGRSGKAPQTVRRDSPASFEVEEATIAGLQQLMQSGEYTARSITEAYLQRIGELDRKGPELRSMIEINPDALAIADGLDAERRARGPRGPLHGIPIVLKDNIDTADRMTTTAGSLALEGSIPSQDSFVAVRLREAGAILLGKTNLSEWANFRSTRSTSGWSARGGLCRNPYVLDRNPCGSSSGSAVAVSANLCAAAIGTETDGSILCPSHANGIVGIKPTVGLISRKGIIPIAHSQDTAGPMTRTVRDAAILLSALAGVDPGDAATRASSGNTHTDYTVFLNTGGLRGSRIGVARRFWGLHAGVDRLMEEAIDVMRRGGAEIIDPADIPTLGQFRASGLEVLLYEFKANINAYLETLDARVQVRSLAQLIDFNERHKDTEMPFFGQELFLEAEKKGPLSSETYLEALRRNHRLSREEGIDFIMNRHRLDAIVAPAGVPAWVSDLTRGDRSSGGSSSPAAVAGYPNITVPAGFVHSLPVGISFFGRAWSEPVLLRIAYAYDEATKHRRPPHFLPSVD